MPYPTLDSLPDWVKEMPKHAQEIYQAAWKTAFEQYKDEGKAAATAITAVKGKYEKNTKGEWVVKESQEGKMSKESLQAKYAEIIQEAGRRGKVNDPRVQKVVAEGDKAEPDELSSVLIWLKEQATMKTEGGVQFPASAFAYVPDAEKPSEWKLRLWEDPEKKVTKAQLGRAAAALSPGGFRGQKVEIPQADMAAVKRKIRAAYRSLDVVDEDIPRWVKEAEHRSMLFNHTSLSEATIGTQGIAKVVIIKPGFGNPVDNNYYPKETLARDFGLFEGVKMYADHQTQEEEKKRPEGSIRQWVASLKNVRFEEGVGIVGDAIIIEPWLQAKLATLRDKSLLSEMGISIRAAGIGTKGKAEGKDANIVERITRVRSADFVTEAGAGGMVQMYEAGNPENDIDIISLDILRERRPDLVKTIETEVKAVIMREVKKTVELQETVDKLTGDIATLTKERDDLKVKITEAEKAQRIAEAKSQIDEAISKSELPEAAKVRIAERFKGAEKAEGIVEAIKAETDYIAALKESGKVKGMGGTQLDVEADRKALKESFKRLGLDDKGAEIAVAGR